ncbi:class I SAM-dependent methyltransferase [Spirosoma endbachense]|uniref:Methyltransferase domain-containing protein n=1 Tax=Spirosoma endbachense TaxID=2666025 RepID=A0A6P1W4H3_9BACT|nr:methyltransferase domain-containing protein [Spirosoma endbachense]QHV99905.1 methyltransferase domain-containing protein [Spirosoma endbachense]
MNKLLEIIQNLDHKITAEGVFLLSGYKPEYTHELPYLAVRAKENRLLSDEIVKDLPNVPIDFPHFREWSLRKQTANSFCVSVAAEKKPLTILDLGCGNGWFSAKLASIPKIDVLGLDLNMPELQQAQKNFGNSNLLFCYGDIFTELFRTECFDKIVLNSSIQYFHSIRQLFNNLFKLLKPTGEIHILDSPFYEIGEVVNAKNRSLEYYQLIGYPDMANYYFHHTYQDLLPYFPIIKKSKPSLWDRVLGMPASPFKWIVIEKPL